MSTDALVPLYGFVAGDTLGLLVLVRANETVAALAESLQQAAAVRVAPRPQPILLAGGRRLDPASTIAAAGLAALDRVDLIAEDG
jgi:hypothetical protein